MVPSGDRQIVIARETKPLWFTPVDFGALRFYGEPARDAMAPPTNPNAPWKVSFGFSYSSGDGSVASIGLVGHRNYGLPLYLSQTIGGDNLTLPLASFTDLSQRDIQWELTVRVGKTLKRTPDGRTISAVADEWIPLNTVSPVPGSTDQPVRPSPAGRAGVAFGF